VPEGTHRVTMTYRPPGLETSLWVTGSSLAALFAGLAAGLVRRAPGEKPA
jgi:hypothetical protein